MFMIHLNSFIQQEYNVGTKTVLFVEDVQLLPNAKCVKMKTPVNANQ